MVPVQTEGRGFMKTLLIILAMLGCLAYLSQVVAAIIRAEAKWWRCAWCRDFFSASGEIRAELPADCDGVVGHGCCPQCAAALRADAVEAKFRAGQTQTNAAKEGGVWINTHTTGSTGRPDNSSQPAKDETLNSPRWPQSQNSAERPTGVKAGG